MPGTHGACVDRVPKAKWSGKKKGGIRLFKHLIQSEALIVHNIRINPEQQQRNLGSFAKV
jgi:hypothetical protein